MEMKKKKKKVLCDQILGDPACLVFKLLEHFASFPSVPSVLDPAGGAGGGQLRGSSRQKRKPEEGSLDDGGVCLPGALGQCDLSPHSPILPQPWASLLGPVTGSCLPATMAGCAQEFVKLPSVPAPVISAQWLPLLRTVMSE